jgi:hypothetical protein
VASKLEIGMFTVLPIKVAIRIKNAVTGLKPTLVKAELKAPRKMNATVTNKMNKSKPKKRKL